MERAGSGTIFEEIAVAGLKEQQARRTNESLVRGSKFLQSGHERALWVEGTEGQ